MEPYERSKLADALKSQLFAPGETIVQEGAVGSIFFVLEQGMAVANKKGPDGKEEVVMRYKPGDYFGELALLRNEPRAASVLVEGDEEAKVCYLNRSAFKRLLGPLEDLMKKNSIRYNTRH
eukprot:Platyproteum_vivax@DN757_c0_g1_i1.p2